MSNDTRIHVALARGEPKAMKPLLPIVANGCTPGHRNRNCRLAHWRRACLLAATLLFILASPSFAQTKLKLSTLKPGTERVQLINNGDFQFQGPLVGTNYPFPSG